MQPLRTPHDVRALFRARRSRRGGDLGDPSGAEIARAYQASHSDRTGGGVFYTPRTLADPLCEAALDAVAAGGAGADEGAAGVGLPRVLDPSCGCGDFLVAMAEACVERGASWAEVVPCLFGVELDATAAELARQRLAERAWHEEGEDVWPTIVAGDALEPATWAGLPVADVVVGNPPFGNAISKQTGRSDAERAAYAARFPHAATGAYDKAGLFVELSLQRLRPGGIAALVLPRALLAARYADALRNWISEDHRLLALWHDGAADHFEGADVYVVGGLFERGADAPLLTLSPGGSAATGGVEGDVVASRQVVAVHSRGVTSARAAESTDAPARGDTVWTEVSLPEPPGARWSVLLSEHAAYWARIPRSWPRLDALVEIRASAAAGEAYEIAPHVSDAEPARGWKLLTTGMIDPGVSHWGTRTTRYLKSDYATPWVPAAAVSATRAALYDRPKVLVAGLSRVLEAFVDVDGSYAGAVATLAITVPGDDVETLNRVADFLNSDAARKQYLALHGAQALGGGSVQVTKRKLGELRVDW